MNFYNKSKKNFILVFILVFLFEFFNTNKSFSENAYPMSNFNEIKFKVFRNNKPLGFHIINFSHLSNEELRVNIEVDFLVKIGFLTLFKYKHRNTEIWRNGNLVELSTNTNDNGKMHTVNAKKNNSKFIIVNNNNEISLPTNLQPTSYWNFNTLKSDKWLDTQRGILVDIKITKKSLEKVELSDNTFVEAYKYTITGDLSLSLWYDKNNNLVKIKFKAKGSNIDYIKQIS